MNYGRRSPIAAERAGRSRTESIVAALAALALALYASSALSLETPAPGSAGAVAQAQTDGDSNLAEAPDSTEQGQVQLPNSFDHRPLASLLHESRLVGFRDTTFSTQIRSAYLDRINFDDSVSQAWVLGGSVGVKSGYFGNFVAFGTTVYTSQRLEGPLDKDGTKLLQPGQEPYTAIGELYGQFRVTDAITVTAGRRAFDSPYVNTQDSLMTPNTFVVYAVQGAVGSTDERTLRFGAGFFDKIKPRNAQDFESMATAAGAPAGVERGVYAAGGTFTAGQFSIGAVDYYSSDIINIGYADIKYTIPFTSRIRVVLQAQYTDQSSTGNDLLTGKPFSTHQEGVKADLALGPALLTVARTMTAVGTVTGSGAGSGTDMRNPWGSYPGYTAVQIENFYRAGENATLLRAAYNFPKLTGLSVYALWVDGSTPNVKNQYAQKETDLNVKWTPQSGDWKRLTLLARYGHVSQGGPTDQHEDEVRLILYYQLR